MDDRTGKSMEMYMKGPDEEVAKLVRTVTSIELNARAKDAELDELMKGPGRYLRSRRFWGLNYPSNLPPKKTPKIFGSDEVDLSVCNNFSSAAIIRFWERLFERERNTNKLVYLCVRYVGLNMDWLSFNANDGPNGKHASVSQVQLPSQIHGLSITCYGCAVWKNCSKEKVIIAGGKIQGFSSENVFIYDIASNVLESPLVMMVRRGENPTVVVANSKIFFFGGGWTDPWAEFFDYDGEVLKHHTSLPDPPQGSKNSKIISHAVHLNGNQILLWLDSCVVLSFNYSGEYWKKYDKPMPIALGPQWSSTVVVFEDFLFWHHHGTLYAHDLLNNVTNPMCTLPCSGFSSTLFSGDVPSPSFLVHVGKGKLCLFYQEDNRIRYITFLLKISQGVGPIIPHIVIGHYGFLATPPVTDVDHALEICY